MANPRINPDSAYVNGAPIPASYFLSVDSSQVHAIDGDAGGNWNPTSGVSIGGVGIGIGGPSTINGGSTISTPSGSGARVTLATNDAIKLQAGHSASTRTIHTGCGSFVDCSAGTSPPLSKVPVISGIPADGVVCYGSGSRFLVPLRTHDGATFTQLAITAIIVGPSNRTLPASQPQIRVYALDAFGNITPLVTTTPAGGWQQFNYVQASYGGSTLTFSFSLNAGVIINNSVYSYIAEVADESGANALSGNAYTHLTCSFSSIPDLRAD